MRACADKTPLHLAGAGRYLRPAASGLLYSNVSRIMRGRVSEWVAASAPSVASSSSSSSTAQAPNSAPGVRHERWPIIVSGVAVGGGEPSSGWLM